MSTDEQAATGFGLARQKANAAHRALDLAGTEAAIRAKGATSLQMVADELNRQGITTVRGGRWNAATVQRLEARV